MTDSVFNRIATLERENAMLKGRISELTQPPDVYENKTRKRMLDIARSACDENGIGLLEIMGRDKSFKISHARQDAMAAMYDAGFSYPQIGKFLGRDHTTIMHGVKVSRSRSAKPRLPTNGAGACI